MEVVSEMNGRSNLRAYAAIPGLIPVANEHERLSNAQISQFHSVGVGALVTAQFVPAPALNAAIPGLIPVANEHERLSNAQISQFHSVGVGALITAQFVPAPALNLPRFSLYRS